MAQSKIQHYRKGPDNQKRADFSIDLKRPDGKQIEKWSEQEKRNAYATLKTMLAVFKAYSTELSNHLLSDNK